MTNDEWSDHIQAGEAFTCLVFQPAVGGQRPNVQLFNPVAAPSPVRVRLRFVQPLALFGIPINVNIRRYDTPLTSLGSFGVVQNLLGSGGAAPVGEPRFESSVLSLGSPFWLILSVGQTRKSYPTKGFSWGQDLLPGRGVTVAAGAGGFAWAGFQWVEVPL